MPIRLSQRLQALADWVPPNAAVVDVGTDHALLPICLIQSGRIRFAVATDVADMPCQSAARNVASAGLADRISVRCGFGLDTVAAGEVDTILIAGMGGAAIRDILSAAPDVVGQASRVIVQPMNLGGRVREYFRDSRFHLVAEQAVLDAGLYYELIVVEPARSDHVSHDDASTWTNPYACYEHDESALAVALMLGPRLLDQPTPAFIQHAADTLAHWRDVESGMSMSTRTDVLAEAHQLRGRIEWLQSWLSAHPAQA